MTQESTLPRSSSPTPPRTPSHLLPFVFGCVFLLLANLGVGGYRALQADTSADTAERLGEISGVFIAILVAVGLAYGLTRLLRKPPRFPVVTFVVLGTLLLGQVGFAVSQFTHATTFTTEERAGLVVTTDSIIHPTLRFWAPNPQGAYSASRVLQHRMDSAFAGQSGIAAWALNSTARGNVIIEASRFSGMTEVNFRAYIQGFRRKMISLADTVLEDHVTWTPGGGEYVLEVRTRRAFLRSRCLSRASDNLIICLQAASVDSAGIGEVPAGFRLKE